MQIFLNLNLIINEVSNSQITSPHQKLADTSVHGVRLSSAGPLAKPSWRPAWQRPLLLREGSLGGLQESWQLEPLPLNHSRMQIFAQLTHTVPFHIPRETDIPV